MAVPEFVTDEMRAAGESVLQKFITTLNLSDIAAKVFQAMSEARDASIERKANENDLPLPENRWLEP